MMFNLNWRFAVIFVVLCDQMEVAFLLFDLLGGIRVFGLLRLRRLLLARKLLGPGGVPDRLLNMQPVFLGQPQMDYRVGGRQPLFGLLVQQPFNEVLGEGRNIIPYFPIERDWMLYNCVDCVHFLL